MKKNNLFDLDIQIKQNRGGVEPRITSVSLCTPGTEPPKTFHSNCCLTTWKNCW